MNELCQHDMAPGTCDLCKARETPFVFVTGGGMAYHLNRDCSALEEGQRNVGDRGGAPMPIETTRLRDASARGYRPCRTCAA
jgi:hypothetical protein